MVAASASGDQTPKGPRSNGNGQLKVVRGRCESLRDCLLIARAQSPSSDNGAHKFNEEVEAHRHCDTADAAESSITCNAIRHSLMVAARCQQGMNRQLPLQSMLIGLLWRNHCSTACCTGQHNRLPYGPGCFVMLPCHAALPWHNKHRACSKASHACKIPPIPL